MTTHPPAAPRSSRAPRFRFAVFGELAKQFGKPILVIHGDEHRYTLDRPFRDPVAGTPVPNMQRLETFGSPDIGWVDVIVDTALAEPFRFGPNVTPRWMWW